VSPYCLLLAGCLFGQHFDTEDGDDVPPKRRTLSKLHGITLKNTVLLIVTAVISEGLLYVCV
jgi:hypothetical protein